MRRHLAILHAPFVKLILAGEKTVESRISRVRCEPFGRVHEGDLIYLKVSGGPVLASARAGRVWSYDGLTPELLERIRRRHNAQVQADEEYWESKRDAVCATMIELTCVRAVQASPRLPARAPGSRKAWYCLGPVRYDGAGRSLARVG